MVTIMRLLGLFSRIVLWPLVLLGIISTMAAAQSTSNQRRKVFTNDDLSPGSGQQVSNDHTDSAAPAPSSAAQQHSGRVAPFVATPMDVVERMLEVASVSAKDIVYDLGSGDGRIVIAAAEEHGARAVGVELDRNLAKESQEAIEKRGLGKLARIIQGDLFEADVSPATVVTVYLLQAANRQLSPILEKRLKPGTRVIAHDIRIPDWRPVEEVSLDSGGIRHFIYLYRVPDSFKK